MNQTTLNQTGLNQTGHKPWHSNILRASIGLAMVTLLLFGLSYALLGTALGRVLFPAAAAGSLIERDGQIIGSSLVAQPFAADRYFQPRPSAAGYNLMSLAGSNQARSNPDLRQRIDEARATVAAREGIAPKDVPSELVTQSGSGIDPHISPAAAQLQLARVARARGLDPTLVGTMVERYSQAPWFGMVGQHRVNVLELNVALDAMVNRDQKP